MLAYPIYATERETRVLEWLAHRVRYDYPVYFGTFAIGSFHVKSSGDFHGPPPILLKFGTLVGIV